jgi:hypothetical protein
VCSIVVRAVLCALLLAVVSGYWWLLLSGIPNLSRARQAENESAAVVNLRTIATHARQAENESAAVVNLRTIATAERVLFSSKGRYGSIEELIAANLLDTRFAKAVAGYGFTVLVSGSDCKATAYPTTTREGRYGFCISASDMIVRYPDNPALAPVGLAGKEIK